MSEAELLAEIISLCDRLGLLCHHCPNSRRCQGPGGLPDLIIVGKAVLFVELKSAGGQLERGQVSWRYMIVAAGGNWRLWQPDHWRDGSIVAELAALRYT